MNPLIITPVHGEECYQIAIERFCELYTKITGKTAQTALSDDGISDLVLIGSDSVNEFLSTEMLTGRIAPLGVRYGMDDYCIRVLRSGDRFLIILAGGRGRSTLYALYDFFERFAGCHYFWDGDVIPHLDDIPLTETDILASPRFEYRGLRYFAHRGLHRFQAEHWNLDEWKQEIDWMVKRRLNFFMLRIGMDDLWQRAFPDDVSYPDRFAAPEPFEGDGYNDRNLFWSLQYRGELRKKLLAYARSLDLTYPEDCGTMSHWYSPAPYEFLDRYQPDFLSQADNQYTQRKTLVWDIRKQRNMDMYMQLTEASVREYSPGCRLFHTIGMAERNMYADREDNLRLKCFAYRKIAQGVREKWPDSTLMLASWDFVGWWKGEEVQSLLRELDPRRTIVLDYTSEVDDPNESFLNWGVIGKFPWIFGIFHAFESQSTLRGPYDRTNERLRVAADDPFCKGMIFWPELSHSDPLILEYLTENAWSPLELSMDELIARFCEKRYASLSAEMNRIWQTALPVIQLDDWGGFTHRTPDDPDYEKYTNDFTGGYASLDIWPRIEGAFPAAVRTRNEHANFAYHLRRAEALHETICRLLALLSALPETDSLFILRDRVDLLRLIVGRTMNRILLKAALTCGEKSEYLDGLLDSFFALLSLLGEILSLHEDYSMYSTLVHLNETEPVPPHFEATLKNNAMNGYCRQHVTEMVRCLYPTECHLTLDPLYRQPRTGQAASSHEEIACIFRETPLADMQYRTEKSFSDLAQEALSVIRTLSFDEPA